MGGYVSRCAFRVECRGTICRSSEENGICYSYLLRDCSEVVPWQVSTQKPSYDAMARKEFERGGHRWSIEDGDKCVLFYRRLK